MSLYRNSLQKLQGSGLSGQEVLWPNIPVPALAVRSDHGKGWAASAGLEELGKAGLCWAWSASPPTGEEFYPQPLNIYGSKCSCTGASLSAHSRPKTPQDFTSWVLFVLQRGDATPNAGWFVLNTWAVWNWWGVELLTLHWTSGSGAPDNSMSSRRFWGAVDVGYSHLEQLWVNYCNSTGKDGDVCPKLQHPDGDSTWK